MSQAVPHGSDRPVRAFIEAKLAHDDAIEDLRDCLYAQMGVSADYRKSDPHLTILPPFTIDKGKAHLVDELIDESGLVGRTIPVKGVGVWPSIKNPRVVLLDTPVEIEAERQALIEAIQDLGAVEMEEPVCPHITLFKTDNGYTVDDHVKTAIQQGIWENRDEWETTIQFVDFTVVTHLSTSPDES